MYESIEIGVVGAGVMGGGIAQMFSENGFLVKLCDINVKYAESGFQKIEKRLRKSAEKGKISQEAAESVLSRISVVEKVEELASSEMVIEAIIEDFDAKKALYSRLEETLTETAVIGSNTSSLSIEGLSKTCRQPERFLGVHFFNPPTKLELVEMVVSSQTSTETTSKVTEILEKCAKTVVEVKDSPGFIVNRLLLPMVNDAVKLLDAKIADAESIDSAILLGAHHPIGPLSLADLIGLDVCEKILNIMSKSLDEESLKPAKGITERVKANELGRKSGSGFFNYK